MAVALAYPDAAKTKRKGSGLNPDLSDVDASYINKARFVLRNCRDKAEEVLANPYYPLTKAYEEAQAIKFSVWPRARLRA